MPLGAPSQTVPKSAWTRRPAPPQLLRSVTEPGSTGCAEMSVFQGLSAGKTSSDPIEPPPLLGGVVGPPLPPFFASAASVSPPIVPVASPRHAAPNARAPPSIAIVAVRRIRLLRFGG